MKCVEMGQIVAVIGTINAAFAIVAAAFGTHSLEAQVAAEVMTARQLEVFETGAEHHLYHAIALVLVGLANHRAPEGAATLLSVAGWLFLVGILLFSGSLYLYGALDMTTLIWVTPIGGMANIVGWLVFASGLFRICR